MGKRIVLTSALVGAIVCALAAPAAAHITVDPASAPKGSTAKLSFLVPNEEATAKVTEVRIQFPTAPETPIPTVSAEQKPGWKVTIAKQKLTTPIETDDGTISEVVAVIDWKALTSADGIAPEQFGEFTVDADGLPEDEDEVVFKAIQTYSNGTVTRWIDPVTPNGPEAEHPTPILKLTAPDDEGGGEVTVTTTPTTTAPTGDRTTIVATSTQDNSARALGIIGIALGAVALILATAALMKKRRR